MADPAPERARERAEGLARFLARYWRDREADAVRPLLDYLALFPGHDDVIASEFHALERSSEPSEMPVLLPRPADRPVEHLGHFRLDSVLGRGGQGTVWLAEDTRLKRRVALKLLALTGPGSANLLPRFHREAEVASRLDHAGICGVLDTGVIDDVPYIAMRFVEGRTLAQMIADTTGTEPLATFFDSLSKRTKLEDAPGDAAVGTERTSVDKQAVETLITMFEKTARALHVAHEGGIVHRDIKPGNIMITPGGEPVVLDFGLAQDLGEEAATLTLSGEWFGTPAYMAPEQVERGPTGIDRRADVWSLGVSLYEALTLRRPFSAATRGQLLSAICNSEPDNPRRLNPAVERDLAVIVSTCLQKEPDARYATALDLAEDLRRARELLPIRARPLSPLARLARWARRHPARAGLAATIVVMIPVLSVLVAFLVATANEREEGRRLLLARAVEEQLERGFFELGEGTDEAAIRSFDQALGTDPGNLEAIAGRALALLECDRPEEALVQLELARDPSRLVRVRAEIIAQLDREAEAAALLDGRPEPTDPVGVFIAGLVEMSRGHRGVEGAFARAADLFGKAVATWPDRPRRSWHIEWLHAIGHTNGSDARLHAATVTERLWPDAPLVWLWAGFALRLQDPPRSRQLLERFLAHDPNRPIALSHLADVASRTNDLDQARDIANALIADHPELSDPHSTLAYVLHCRGDLGGALREYRIVHEKRGPGITLNCEMAKLLMQLDEQANAPEAERFLREADTIEPNLQVRIVLGFCLLTQDRIDDAIDSYVNATRVDPLAPEPWVCLGELYTNTGRYEKALDAYRRAHVLGTSKPGWDYPSAQWLEEGAQLVADAKRLRRVLAGEDQLRDLTDLRKLVGIAVVKNAPTTVLDLWDRARSGEVPMSPEERAPSAFEAALQSTTAAKESETMSGAWLDRILDLLREEVRRIRSLPANARAKALDALRGEPGMRILRNRAWLEDFDEPQRISMLRFWTEVQRDGA